MNQAEETAAFAGGTHGDSIDPAHDWEVTLSPAFGIGPDGLVEVPGRNVVMAGGRAIDVVGSRWHPVQNREVLSIARGVALPGSASGVIVAVTGCPVASTKGSFIAKPTVWQRPHPSVPNGRISPNFT